MKKDTLDYSQMKQLKDIKYYDPDFDSIDDFRFHNNRFLLFDREGYELNPYYLETVENVLELPVLETTFSSYEGYGVGFRTLHIKLMYSLEPEKEHLRDKHFKFGDIRQERA